MDKNFFSQKVLMPLERWSRYGESTNSLDTRLIGHAPHIAPKAHVHVIYAPLDDMELKELTEEIGIPLPSQYQSFLTFANGMSLFVGSIMVLGYVPSSASASPHIYDYPRSVALLNVEMRIRGLNEGAAVVGRYTEGYGSYLSIEADGRAVRFDPKGNGSVSAEWPDFDTWLSSEIEDHDRAFLEQWTLDVSND